MRGAKDFAEWFDAATGSRSHKPYAYQRALAEAEAPPSILSVPTGGGKTQAVLGAWLYQRRQGIGPRRLVYALPMRSLVEQTRDVAIAMREALGLNAETLPVHVLMGGEERPKDDWRLRPEADQILIGTIDMLLSRALNRGYGESRYSWPISFGLLNADCRWVFDEVQLMGPARATSAQLAGLRTVLGTALPCESMWVSATVDPEALQTFDRPEAGETMSLPDADRRGGLKKRLNAEKRLDRIDLSETEPKSVPRAIAEIARERHVSGARTLVVLNRVDTAQAVYTQLRKLSTADAEPTTVLLHSRFRPGDRAAHMEAAKKEPGGAGTIVVSTQVIEAGVDLSSQTLLTETAPFSSIVQRLGRCNREGEYEKASAVWLDMGPIESDVVGRRVAAPYLPEDIAAARNALLDLGGQSLSPQRLETIKNVSELPDDPATLRRRDLLDLFDTGPDLSGTDIDVAPFIRDDDHRTVLACFRAIDEDNQPIPDGLPDASEIVQIPRHEISKRACWTVDHVVGGWEFRRSGNAPPGSTVVLDAASGGYLSDLGWEAKSRTPVEVIEADAKKHNSPGGAASTNLGHSPQLLIDHLKEVSDEASRLADLLDLAPWKEALTNAAALHDLGKAHQTFQDAMRVAMGIEAGSAEDGRLWAKSGTGSWAGYDRRAFRHELAGALALRTLDDVIVLPLRDLTIYLVAAHHGRVRLSIRPATGEIQVVPPDTPFALGIIDGDQLPATETPLGTLPATTLDLTCMELGALDSWTDAAVALRDSPELGPLRLAFLEAVLRMADWRASA